MLIERLVYLVQNNRLTLAQVPEAYQQSVSEELERLSAQSE